MSDEPIERLNYYNGQRLEAEDFRLEQEYHQRIQRWLSKSLFSAGVADGLEVYRDDADHTKVLVTPGLALDDLGRAIINVRPVTLIAQAKYLCIRYAERKERQEQGSCHPRGAQRDQSPQWGGPSRILSEPEFLWRTAPPQQDERELVIAQLELMPDCSIARVASGPTKFAVATQVSRVYSYALEGEKDIDCRNPKILRFHINGRTPNSVSLCLRARKFSTLYYTEMGRHTHGAHASNVGNSPPALSDPQTGAEVGDSLETGPALSLDEHKHCAGSYLETSDHSHDVLAPVHAEIKSDEVKEGDKVIGYDVTIPPKSSFKLEKEDDNAILQLASDLFIPGKIFVDIIEGIFGSNENYAQINLNRAFGAAFCVLGGKRPVLGHTDAIYRVASPDPDSLDPNSFHKHTVSVGIKNDSYGCTTITARDGAPPLSHFSNLNVRIDGSASVATVAAITAQLARCYPEKWAGRTSLDGGQADPMSGPDGTGLIRLDLLELDNISFGPGLHEIEFSLEGEGNGGCLQYNLYVE